MTCATTRGWRAIAAGAVGLAALGLGPTLGCGEEGATTTEEEIERLTTAEDVEIDKDPDAVKERAEEEQEQSGER